MAENNQHVEQKIVYGVVYAQNNNNIEDQPSSPTTLAVTNTEPDQVFVHPEKTETRDISSPQPREDDSSRGQWGNKIEFFLAVVGFSIGVGNVFRFPYVCYKNGGGAFLIPYFIALACCGMPLMFLELAWGQYSSEGPITAWSVCPLFSGIGVCACTMTAIVILYYNVIMCYSVFYMFASFTTGELPWAHCGGNRLGTEFTGFKPQMCSETITDE